jgi:RNA polymerase sigma-70 factor, ECF subfamily
MGIDLPLARHLWRQVHLSSRADDAETQALPAPASLATGLAPSAPQAEQELRLVEVVHRHHGLVWRMLRRLGTPLTEADDATQQVFWTFSQRSALVEPGREVAFLISVAIKVAANTRRKVDRRREVHGVEEELAGQESPETLLQQKQLRELLDRGLDTLLPEQRAVFVLFELEGFSLPEIATLFEIPLGTATSRLRRARDHLEKWLRQQPDGDNP